MIEKVIETVEHRIAELSVRCCKDERESEIKNALIKENEIFLDLIEEWFPNKFVNEVKLHND